MDEPYNISDPEPIEAIEQPPFPAGNDEPLLPQDTPPEPEQINPVQPEPVYWPAPAIRQVLPGGAVQVGGETWAPAGFWPRTGAFLLDMLFLVVISQILVAITGVRVPDLQQMLALCSKSIGLALNGAGLSSQASGALEQAEQAMQFASWLNIAICGAYFTVMHGIAGATLGKLALGLRVFRRDGRPLGLGWAFLRYLGYLLFAKVAYSAWMIPFDSERRTLYDIVLTTNVYRKHSAPGPYRA